MKTRAQLESQVYAFNKTYHVGARVKLEMNDGKIKIVHVKAQATVLSESFAVGWFYEKNGCYSLDRVRS